MKIFDENGKQLSVSDIYGQDIESSDGSYSVPILWLSPDDAKGEHDVDDVVYAGRKIGESECVMSAFWIGVEEYLGESNFGDDEDDDNGESGDDI